MSVLSRTYKSFSWEAEPGEGELENYDWKSISDDLEAGYSTSDDVSSLTGLEVTLLEGTPLEKIYSILDEESPLLVGRPDFVYDERDENLYALNDQAIRRAENLETTERLPPVQER